MLTKDITIINKLGLHARASAKFVSTAGQFDSSIKVTKANQTVDGKSIMGIMTLAASLGTQITLSTEGPDEQDAMSALVKLIANRFGEDE